MNTEKGLLKFPGIGMAIQKNVSLTELETFQMATHPYLTPAPTKYHLVIAAQNALKDL